MSTIYCNISDNVIIDNNKIIITSSNQKNKKIYQFGIITKYNIIHHDEFKIIYYECNYNNKKCSITNTIVNKLSSYNFDKLCSIITPTVYKTTKNGLKNTIRYITLGVYGPFVIFCFPKVINVYNKLLTFYNTKCLPYELLLYIIEIYLTRYHNYNFIDKPLFNFEQLTDTYIYDEIENNYISRYKTLTYSKKGLHYLYKKGYINLSIFSIIDDSFITLTSETYLNKNIKFCNHYKSLDDFLLFRDRCVDKLLL